MNPLISIVEAELLLSFALCICSPHTFLLICWLPTYKPMHMFTTYTPIHMITKHMHHWHNHYVLCTHNLVHSPSSWNIVDLSYVYIDLHAYYCMHTVTIYIQLRYIASVHSTNVCMQTCMCYDDACIPSIPCIHLAETWSLW